MTTTLRSPEQRVVLDHISWDIYESLLIAHRERSVPRFTYDRGELEIVSPSAEHEQLTRIRNRPGVCLGIVNLSLLFRGGRHRGGGIVRSGGELRCADDP